jgi:hypothetical protein
MVQNMRTAGGMDRKQEPSRSQKMDLSGPVKLMNRMAFESLAAEASSSVNGTGRAVARFSSKADEVQREIQACRRGAYMQPRKFSGPFSSVVLAVRAAAPLFDYSLCIRLTLMSC